jgi:hypothetical protein
MAGVWTKNNAGVWVLSAPSSERTVVIAVDELPSDTSIRLQCKQPADNVKVLILSAKDGRSAIEVGIEGANAVIRPVTHAVAGGNLDSAAHGLSAGVPFVMEVRLQDLNIECFLNDSTTAVVEYDNSSAKTFAKQKHYGFVSAVDGAKVLSADVCDLIPQLLDQSDVLIAVCQGDVWYSDDGGTLSLLRAGVFKQSADVSLVEIQQKMYGVDGATAQVIDPIALTVTALVPTAGSLPGATVGVDGSTRATFAARFQGRLVLGRDPQDPQNLFMSAVNDALDWDTAGVGPGRAFALSASNRAKIGQPITCVQEITADTLLIGCVASVWKLVGDPALTLPSISPVMIGSGISGPEAIHLAEEGITIAHSPDGAFLLPVAGGPVGLSAGVLTKVIQIARALIDTYRVQVRRDTARHVTHFFLTSRAAAISFHCAYDERVGEFQRGSGGWFIDLLPVRIGPTASTVWRGEVLLGTRDGFVCVFEDAAKSDDGTAIEARFACGLIQRPDLNRDAVLRKLAILKRVQSDPVTYRVFGGLTPQQVFTGFVPADRWILLEGTAPDAQKPIVRGCRSPFLLLELSNTTLGQGFAVEAVEASVSSGRLTRRRRRTPSPAPAPCPPPGGKLGSTPEATPSSAVFSDGPGNTETEPSQTQTTARSSPPDTPTPSPLPSSAATSTPPASSRPTTISIPSSSGGPGGGPTIGDTQGSGLTIATP